MGRVASRWRTALAAARRLAPAPRWRGELAEAVRAGAGARFAAVMTCPPGQMGQVQVGCDPLPFGALMQRIGAEYVPRIEEAGEGWEFAVRTHGLVYAPLDCAIHTAIAAEIHDKVLSPAGVRGYVVSWLVDRRRGLLGFVVVGAATRSQPLLDETRTALLELSTAATATLVSALDLAEGCGAQAPARLAGLTARQLQIAALAARGLSNLNIGSRLTISEQTVAVHLRHVYGRLGVHSRAELAGRLAGLSDGDSLRSRA